jgi:pimeloyl-ACP methyl ester carboxylesterase
MTELGVLRRLYALDFWGFGESGTRRSSYAILDFVSLVVQFMQQMGITRAPLVGHSMGGTVALLTAMQHPERVERLAVIASPIEGSSLFFFPRVFGYRPVGWLVHHNLWLYRRFYHLLAARYSKDPMWAAMMDRDVSQTTLEAFFTSIGSLRSADLRPKLNTVRIAVLGMYGARDNVVDPRQGQVLQEGIPEANIETFSSAGHFIMLDEPEEFMRALTTFLEE